MLLYTFGMGAATPTTGKAGGTLLQVVLALVVVGIATAVLFPLFLGVQETYHGPRPLSVAKQQALALMLYTVDNGDRLPPAETWVDASWDYAMADRIYQDPSIVERKEGEYGFAFFDPVSLIDLRTLVNPAGVPLVFQSVLMRRNAHSDLGTLPRIPRSFRGQKGLNIIAFCDGHVKGYPPSWPERPIVVAIKNEGAQE
jgi:prepilin-type processing-associated H-X9-DG protein